MIKSTNDDFLFFPDNRPSPRDNAPSRLSSKEAAAYIGHTERTMRRSRKSGILLGIKAPPHTNYGSVVYLRKDIDKFLENFDTGLRVAPLENTYH